MEIGGVDVVIPSDVNGNLIAARCVKYAFTEKTGNTIYLKMSPNGIKFLKLDQSKVYGISFENGNITVLNPQTLVVDVPFNIVFTKYLLGDKLDEVFQYYSKAFGRKHV